MASAPDALLLAAAAPPRPAAASRRTISTTSTAQRKRMPALHSSRFSVPSRLTTRAVSPAPVMPPRLDPPPMKPNMPLRLPRVVDVVGERPELADEQDAEDQPEEVERHRDPVARRPEEEPEGDQQRRHPGQRQGDHPAAGQARDAHAVALHDDADQHAGRELDVGQVVGAQAGDELRPRDRLDDVVRRHRQERVGEHQERGGELAFPELRHGDSTRRIQLLLMVLAEDAGVYGLSAGKVQSRFTSRPGVQDPARASRTAGGHGAGRRWDRCPANRA